MMRPKLSEEESEILSAKFTQEDYEQSINCLQVNKAPGSEGLTSEFYKKFSNYCKIIIEWIMDESLKVSELPSMPN